jgi:hypothetical protein
LHRVPGVAELKWAKCGPKWAGLDQFWAAWNREGEINTRRRDDASPHRGAHNRRDVAAGGGESPRRRVLTVEVESWEGQGMACEIEGDAELAVMVEQLREAQLVTETETDPATVSEPLLERLHHHLLAGRLGEVIS